MKMTKQRIKVRLTWKQKDCIITKDFFTTIKPKPNKMGISTLKDDIEAIATNQIEMESIATTFTLSSIKPKKIILGMKNHDIRSWIFSLEKFLKGT